MSLQNFMWTAEKNNKLGPYKLAANGTTCAHTLFLTYGSVQETGMEVVLFGRSKLCVSLVWVMVMVCTVVTVVSCEDLYRVLGVPRSASVKEIRRAHKTLAKEWWVS